MANGDLAIASIVHDANAVLILSHFKNGLTHPAGFLLIRHNQLPGERQLRWLRRFSERKSEASSNRVAAALPIRPDRYSPARSWRTHRGTRHALALGKQRPRDSHRIVPVRP